MEELQQACKLNAKAGLSFSRMLRTMKTVYEGWGILLAGKGRPGKAAPAADATVHVTTSKRAAAEAAPAAEAEEAMEEDEEAAPKAQGRKPRKASAGAKRPAPGNVKLHDSTSGQQLFL